MKNELDIKALDTIFNSMVHAMDRSKNDIFIISEQSRGNFEEMQLELALVQAEISRIIDENDELEVKSKHSRMRLANVSQNFSSYSEQQVRESYEVANKLLVDLSINKMEEKQLRERRDDLERRLEGLLETIQRADQLGEQVSFVMNYLTSELQDVGKALEDAQHKQGFAMKIIEAQEEERKRVSRDIHDGPAQMLAHVLLRAGLVEKVFIEKGAEPALTELKDLKENVKDALGEVRRIIYDLRPMALDDLGLIPTLKKYLHKIEELEKNVEIIFQNSGQQRRFQTKIEVAVFRLVQESVSNAIKHGKPTSIWVKIEWLNDILNIVVKDNGKGFDQSEVQGKSFGLIGMRERIEILNGQMKIGSTINEGTSILFRIPLDDSILD